jgi:hypothetical protein
LGEVEVGLLRWRPSLGISALRAQGFWVPQLHRFFSGNIQAKRQAGNAAITSSSVERSVGDSQISICLAIDNFFTAVPTIPWKLPRRGRKP